VDIIREGREKGKRLSTRELVSALQKDRRKHR